MYTEARRVALLVIALCYTTEALDCGIHFNKNEELTRTIGKCLSSNKTLEDLWDMAPMSSESQESSSSEEDPPVDGKMLKSFRTKRTIIHTQEPQEQVNTTEEGQSEPPTENCVIQCIFENLQMTDNSGYPVHAKIVEGLMKNVTNKELEDFLQDTTDECFQMMDKETTMDPCAYSTKLVTCLADKGKSNCSDWPVGDLPFHP